MKRIAAAPILLTCTARVLAASATEPAANDSLTFHGITLYGTVDIGLQYETHGAPISDYFPGGGGVIVGKNSNRSTLGATPSNLSQSRIGLAGTEPVIEGWSAVFKLETFFNPQSGELGDGLKSLTLNNGRPLAQQSTNLDTSVAGQIFQQSYVGLSSPSFGTLTFGRQNTLLADGIAKYDPNLASQAFSVIGISGTAAGGGDTEDRRLSSSLKYTLSHRHIHFGAMYKFNGASGSANTVAEAEAGYDIQGLSVDAYYVHAKDAIAHSALSASQLSALPSYGLSSSNSVAGVVSDNTAFAVMALYSVSKFDLYAGWDRLRYSNPATPLPIGYETEGGYQLGAVNNTAFPHPKILQVYWAGVRYKPLPLLDLVAAYYGYHQNSYGTKDCSTDAAAACSGELDAASFDADVRLTKRFDVYAGAIYSRDHDGLASGYLRTSNISTTIGVRFSF
jgi:predicted porin